MLPAKVQRLLVGLGLQRCHRNCLFKNYVPLAIVSREESSFHSSHCQAHCSCCLYPLGKTGWKYPSTRRAAVVKNRVMVCLWRRPLRSQSTSAKPSKESKCFAWSYGFNLCFLAFSLSNTLKYHREFATFLNWSTTGSSQRFWTERQNVWTNVLWPQLRFSFNMLWACILFTWNLFLNGPKFLFLSMLMVKFTISCMHWKQSAKAHARLLSQFGGNCTLKMRCNNLGNICRLQCHFQTCLPSRHWSRQSEKAQLKVSVPLKILLLTVRSDLIDFMSCAIETFIMKKARGDSRFNVSRALPAILRKSLNSDPRCEENQPNSRVQVDPENIWKLLVAAQNAGTSLRQALKLKKEDINY